MLVIKVDVIIAIYNAESTIEQAVRSAMHQVIPDSLVHRLLQQLEKGGGGVVGSSKTIHWDVCVCCYNDASTDGSFEILTSLLERETQWEGTPIIISSPMNNNCCDDDNTEQEYKITMQTRLLMGSAPIGTFSRGAGYARNQAVKLRDNYDKECSNNNNHNHTDDNNTEGSNRERNNLHFLCILDSDDVMHPTRIAELTCAMLSLGGETEQYKNVLMGSQFDRIPNDSTHHYSRWANSLSDERLYLEKFRECTLIQPTWFLSKEWFEHIGGYLQAPSSSSHDNYCTIDNDYGSYRLVHSSEISDSITRSKHAKPLCNTTLHLAEDMRFYYAHLHAGGRLHLHRTPIPLVSYRHRHGMSQSYSTPRKLLLKLRAKAWEDLIFYDKTIRVRWSDGFVIWGAGRDGKDFFKALSPAVASKVICFVDVDRKKIEQTRWYVNPSLGDRRIPILHFSVLARGDIIWERMPLFGHIDKKRCIGRDQFNLASKVQVQTNDCNRNQEITKVICKEKSDTSIDPEVLQQLPVVVCVAMYRSNGALENNVASIGRIEGVDLWHVI